MTRELNIGEMASLNCVSPKTLRIYHEMGLLAPKRVDSATGYRFYDATQSFILDQIQQLQAMGATLSQIRDAAYNEDPQAFVDLVRARRDALDEEIARLRLARRTADEYLHNYESYLAPGPVNTVVVEHFPERYAILLPLEHPKAVPISNETGPDVEAWEVALRLAKKRMVERNIPLELFNNVGWNMTCDDFCSGNYRITHIAIAIRTPGLARQHNASVIAEGDWATLCVRGYLGKNGANSEYAALQLLAARVAEKGLEPCGDCMSEVLFNAPTLFDGCRDAFFKLQVPVRARK